MSQIIAGAVPLLLVLLLLPVAPTIEKIVHTDFVAAPPAATTTSTSRPIAAQHGATTETTAPPVAPPTTTTTSTSVAPSRHRTGPIVAPTATTTTSTSTSTTTTTDPPPTDSGTLTPSDDQAETPVAAGSNWVMSPWGTPSLTWSLVCGTSTTPLSGESVHVSPVETNCVIEVKLTGTTDETWQLTAY